MCFKNTIEEDALPLRTSDTKIISTEHLQNNISGREKLHKMEILYKHHY
jgi:hypothetical protein